MTVHKYWKTADTIHTAMLRQPHHTLAQFRSNFRNSFTSSAEGAGDIFYTIFDFERMDHNVLENGQCNG